MVQIRRRRYEGERRHGDGSRSLLLRRQAGRSLSLVLRGERFRAAPHGLAAAYPITAAASLAVAAVQVIRQLPPNLVVDIMVFYLVLRALDTIEDDMQAFKGAEHKKVANPPGTRP